MDFVWKDIEPTRDAPFNFIMYDQFVEWAKNNGVEIIAVLLQVPPWILAGETVIPSGDVFDDFVIQFGQFVYGVVNHYKGKIKYFEIWNEPNITMFWRDPEGTVEYDIYNRGASITKYVTLLKKAYTQAKAANPNCVVISAGISECDHEYVEGMYLNGAKGYFDVLGLHPFFGNGPTKNYDPDWVDWQDWEYWHFPKIKLVRDVMVANADAKNIFVTEVGVNAKDGPEGPTTEEIQARALTRVFEKINHDPGYPYVEAVMWYQLIDTHAGEWGLLRSDYTPRQMYYAYKTWIMEHPPTPPIDLPTIGGIALAITDAVLIGYYIYTKVKGK